jgi:hypothetical protein
MSRVLELFAGSLLFRPMLALRVPDSLSSGGTHLTLLLGMRRSLIPVVLVLNQFVGVGKHGIEESRRVLREFSILKCNDYASA